MKINLIERARISKLIRYAYPYFRHLFDFFSLAKIENIQLRAFIKSVNPDCILDIGANLGQFIVESSLSGFKGKYIAIEPISELHSRYSKLHSLRDFISLDYAIANNQSIVNFNISNDSGMSSSLLNIGEDFKFLDPEIHAIESRTVKTFTLDAILRNYCSDSEKILVKIDVQGSELEVVETLSIKHHNVVAIILETSFMNLYEKGGTASRVITDLYQKGFEVISIKEKGYIKDFKRFSYCDIYSKRL